MKLKYICILLIVVFVMFAGCSTSKFAPRLESVKDPADNFTECATTVYGRGVIYYHCEKPSDFGTSVARYLNDAAVYVDAVVPVQNTTADYWVFVR